VGAPIEGTDVLAQSIAPGALRRRACYRRRMGRAFDLILSLVVAAMMASLLAVVAQDADMTGEAVRLNALSVAGLISAVLAGRALLKRK
jgi:peptidoglycan/LPS O-acetylase OafA/YrhL